MKESYGDLEALKKLGENKKLSFTKEQLIDKKLKNIEGESNNDVVIRMNEFFNEIINTNSTYKNVAVISHGAAIKFFLSQFCIFNEEFELLYNSKVLKINSPSVLKIIVNDNKIKDIIQIY